MTLDNRGLFLAGRGFDRHSQFGEDGLIDAAIKKFGAVNQWCFEVGANDGVFFSNTLLLREAGWSCLLVESDAKYEAELRSHCTPSVHVRIATISENCPLDTLLDAAGAPEDLDLGVIDIDGQDWWAWHDMRAFRPRLMLVEFNRAENAALPKRGESGQQAGLDDIVRLGIDKGYVPLAKTHVNALFVREDLCPR